MPQPFPLPLCSSSLSKITREKQEGEKSGFFFSFLSTLQAGAPFITQVMLLLLQRDWMSTWAHRQLFPLPGLSFAVHSCFLSLSCSKTAVGSRESPPGASPALYKYLGAEENNGFYCCG